MPNYVIYDLLTDRVKKWVLSDPHDPIYPTDPGDGFIKDPIIPTLVDKNGNITTPIHYWKHKSGSIVEMSPPEKNVIDAEELPQYKNSRNATIRAKTEYLMRRDGFSYNTFNFSLDQISRMQWAINYLTRDIAIFPVRISSSDGKEFLIVDAAMAVDFYKSSISSVQSFQDDERLLLKLVASAPNQKAVDAIKDNR